MLHSHLLFQLHIIDGDSRAKVQCQCKVFDSVDVCRRVLLKNKMFDGRCGNHTTMVNPKINSPHFPLIQKSASRGAKTLRRERSIYDVRTRGGGGSGKSRLHTSFERGFHDEF